MFKNDDFSLSNKISINDQICKYMVPDNSISLGDTYNLGYGRQLYGYNWDGQSNLDKVYVKAVRSVYTDDYTTAIHYVDNSFNFIGRDEVRYNRYFNMFNTNGNYVVKIIPFHWYFGVIYNDGMVRFCGSAGRGRRLEYWDEIHNSLKHLPVVDVSGSMSELSIQYCDNSIQIFNNLEDISQNVIYNTVDNLSHIINGKVFIYDDGTLDLSDETLNSYRHYLNGKKVKTIVYLKYCEYFFYCLCDDNCVYIIGNNGENEFQNANAVYQCMFVCNDVYAFKANSNIVVKVNLYNQMEIYKMSVDQTYFYLISLEDYINNWEDYRLEIDPDE